MLDLKQIFPFLLLFFASTLLLAQNDEITITNHGFEDGLSHRNVFKVRQDTSGFLWVATAKGLNRFDGHRYLTWDMESERHHIPQDNLRDLILDDQNRLWCAASNGSLFRLDFAKNKLDTIASTGNAIGERRLSDLCQGGTGKIWAVSYRFADSTTWLLRSNTGGKLEDLAPLPGRYEGRPIARVGGLMYVGAFENEIWVFNIDGQQVKQYEFTAPSDDPRYSRILQLQTGHDGSLWALLDHGQVYRLAPGASSFQRHAISNQLPGDLRTTALSVGRNGDVWVGGIIVSLPEDGSPCSSVQPGASLFHHNANTGLTKDLSYYLKKALPYAEPPRQIFQDRTGVIWISTAFGLIQVVDHDLFTRYMSDGNDCCRDGVCSIRGITEDDQGNIYFAYYNSIHVLNPRSGSLTPMFAKQIGAPFGILYHQGAIYTGEGIRINLQSFRTDTVVVGLAGKEGVVMLDGDGEIWFGNGNRLFLYNPATGRSVPFGGEELIVQEAPNFQSISCLFFAKNSNSIWMGTVSSGIFELKKDGRVLRHFNDQKAPALPHPRILGIFENGGKVWAASAAGLCRLNTDSEKLKVFTTKDGLPNNFINGLLPEGDSAVWVSTDNGLSRLDLRTERFSSFFAADGLSKNEFNRISCFQASDGRMYFGGINGVNAFYPSGRYGMRLDSQNGRLVLTGFERFDGEIDTQQDWAPANGQNFELSHRDQMFTFHFALADFSNPDIHLYSYQLEGYDKDWTPASPVSFARYFNIPAGKYVFRVRASRGGGDWVPNQLAIPVHIRQAFYKSGWFQMLALGLVSLLIYAFMRYRLFLAKQHEQELEALVQVRTQELETEKAKSDELLLNILPADTAEELKKFGKTKARRYENVTVMFSDFKEFSIISADMEPEDLVAEIDLCFRAFDEITEQYGLEKIKTVGDAYLLAGGISHHDNGDAAVRVVLAALEMQTFLHTLATERLGKGIPSFEARVGIHSGPVVAGIVGFKKFAYDIWGDTVNVAERLQSSGEVGKVNVSKSTYELVKHRFECTYRGKINAKHRRQVEMYFIEKSLT